MSQLREKPTGIDRPGQERPQLSDLLCFPRQIFTAPDRGCTIESTPARLLL